MFISRIYNSTVMKRRRFLLLILAALLCAGTMQAQITHYSDSSSFDDAFARLREIDFEDVYSVTLERITIRNPWGLNCFGNTDSTKADTVNSTLLLGQGASLDFPTRTRTVELTGFSHQFQLVVTDFNDAVDTTAMMKFPVTLTRTAGIKRLQFIGADQFGDWDINWSAGFHEMRTLDDHGDTLAYTEFEELLPDHYYLTGIAQDATQILPDSTFMGPVEWHGITITEPTLGFAGLPLSQPEGRVDPDNPIMNLEIELAPGATVDFPEGTEGVLLTFEAIQHLDTFWVAVTDYAGNTDTVEAMGWGHPVMDSAWVEDQWYTFVHLGFGSPDGIKQVEFLGATGPYSYGTVALATVALAETPVQEMMAIRSVADDLKGAGFLDDAHYESLNSDLVAAIAAADINDRSGAIQKLNDFRADVQQLSAGRVLVPEETEYFMDDAAYVITRLSGTSGVETAGGSQASRVMLDAPVVSAEHVRLRYDAPAGSDPVVAVHDLRGALVRMLPLGSNAGELLWDLRDGNGNRVPFGTYLLTLSANGERATQVVRVVR
jgi:hypothetical protein